MSGAADALRRHRLAHPLPPAGPSSGRDRAEATDDQRTTAEGQSSLSAYECLAAALWKEVRLAQAHGRSALRLYAELRKVQAQIDQCRRYSEDSADAEQDQQAFLEMVVEILSGIDAQIASTVMEQLQGRVREFGPAGD